MIALKIAVVLCALATMTTVTYAHSEIKNLRKRVENLNSRTDTLFKVLYEWICEETRKEIRK